MRGSSPCLLVGSSVLGLGSTVRCLTTALQYALVNMLLFFCKFVPYVFVG